MSSFFCFSVIEARNLGLDTNTIIKSENFPTGLVNVILDEQGSASYDIKYPSA